jgi:hypothetical protein
VKIVTLALDYRYYWYYIYGDAGVNGENQQNNNQIWAVVRNGKIIDGGINIDPYLPYTP